VELTALGVCSSTDRGEVLSHHVPTHRSSTTRRTSGQGGFWSRTWHPPHPGHPVSASTPAWSLCNYWDDGVHPVLLRLGKGQCNRAPPPPNKATAQLPGSQTCQARAKPGRSTRSRNTNDSQPFLVGPGVKRGGLPSSPHFQSLGWPPNIPADRFLFLLMLDVQMLVSVTTHSLLTYYDIIMILTQIRLVWVIKLKQNIPIKVIE
jgi:hypothetical protein